MDVQSPEMVTQLLDAVGRGDDEAHGRLWHLIYQELHNMAVGQMAHERAGHTLQPTALVHEAYSRLIGSNGRFECRGHFFSAAARAMRQVLVDYARKKMALKRDGETRNQGEPTVEFDQDPSEVLAVEEALANLEKLDSELAEVVHFRYFAGLSVDETAEILGISSRTVDNRWRSARAWLHRALGSD